MDAFTRKTPKELEQMTSSDRKAYFESYRDYILSLPFDEEKVLKGEETYLNIIDFLIPKFIKGYEPNIIGKQHKDLPKNFILVSNHCGSFDQFLDASAFPDIPFHYMIADTLLSIKNWHLGVLGKLYIKMGCFAVDRKNPESRRSVETISLQYLHRGYHVAIKPEGTRAVKYGSDGTVQSFKDGAVRFAQASGVPILPTAINNNFKKGKSYINIGDFVEVGYDDSVAEKNQELREKVIELWEENRDLGAEMILKQVRKR